MLIYEVCQISDIADVDIKSTYELLSNSQTAYLRSLNNTKRKQSLAVRALLKTVLQNNFEGICISQLSADSKGKPCLIDSNLFISLAHSADYVGCAVSDNAVGIDIEKIKPVKSSVIKRVCSTEEIINIKTDADFFTCWTLKEAYVKATGKTKSKFCELSFANDKFKNQFNTVTNETNGYIYSVVELV